MSEGAEGQGMTSPYGHGTSSCIVHWQIRAECAMWRDLELSRYKAEDARRRELRSWILEH